MIDWLLISCIASFVAASVIAFILWACWQAGIADEQSDHLIERIEADRVIRHGDQHPWMDR